MGNFKCKFSALPDYTIRSLSSYRIAETSRSIGKGSQSWLLNLANHVMVMSVKGSHLAR